MKYNAGNAVRIVLPQFRQQVSHIDIADGGAGHGFHRQNISSSDIHGSRHIADAVALGVVITFRHIDCHSRPADLQTGQVEGLSAEAPAHRLLSPVGEARHTILDIQFRQLVAVIFIDPFNEAIVTREGKIVGNRHVHEAAADIFAGCNCGHDIPVRIFLIHIVHKRGRPVRGNAGRFDGVLEVIAVKGLHQVEQLRVFFKHLHPIICQGFCSGGIEVACGKNAIGHNRAADNALTGTAIKS